VVGKGKGVDSVPLTVVGIKTEPLDIESPVVEKTPFAVKEEPDYEEEEEEEEEESQLDSAVTVKEELLLDDSFNEDDYEVVEF